MLYDHEVGTRSKVTHSSGDAPGCTERAAVTWGQMMGLVNLWLPGEAGKWNVGGMLWRDFLYFQGFTRKR